MSEPMMSTVGDLIELLKKYPKDAAIRSKIDLKNLDRLTPTAYLTETDKSSGKVTRVIAYVCNPDGSPVIPDYDKALEMVIAASEGTLSADGTVAQNIARAFSQYGA